MINKENALREHLIDEEGFDDDVEIVYNGELFEVGGREYYVFTDEEADEKAKEEIEYSLWAFNPDFILRHSSAWDNLSIWEADEAEEALRKMQSSLCESANAIVRALISDMDEFIEDAIDADGRGHFISWWDGREYEAGGYYIYRNN